MKTDILIVGAGCAGLYCALHLPKEKQVLIITKDAVRHSDSFLAQGGICMLKDDSDYESYFEDTMRAGHYENNPESVEIMIRSSQTVVKELIRLGVSFQREENGELSFTREGGHSQKRILFHEDITGKEITSKLLERVKARPNVQILEYAAMLDLLSEDNCCYGAVVRLPDGTVTTVLAETTVLACGGIGGLYRYTTNYRHLTGDGIAVAFKHGVALEHINYVQIHPTTLYCDKPQERSFLISESVRGEGAVLYNKNMERFVDELLPRDILTKKIYEQMEKDQTPYVWLSMEHIPQEELTVHFPNIVKHCREKGYLSGVHSGCSRAALFYGRNSDRSVRAYLYGTAVCRRRDRLQRRTWQKPSGKQFSAGEPCICGAGGGRNNTPESRNAGETSRTYVVGRKPSAVSG